MRKKLLPIGYILLGLAMLVSNFVPRAVPPITLQQRASHRLTYMGRPEGYCTGTAVGPHAILTAKHCDEHGQVRTIRLDLSSHDYHIIFGIGDDRDHIILLIDGPALEYFVPDTKLLGITPIMPGEKFYIYGNPGGSYPATRREGVLAKESQSADVSEVDISQGVVYYTFPVIPGDSGAAIYGEDGRVAGVVTYQWSQGDAQCTGFSLNFTPDELEYAQRFDSKNMVLVNGQWIYVDPTVKK